MKKVLLLLTSFFLILIFISFPEPSFAVQRFSDIQESSDLFEATSYVFNIGAMVGYEQASFLPIKKINRAEFLKVIMRAFYPDEQYCPSRWGDWGYNCDHIPPDHLGCFSDIHDEWFAQYVCLAKKKGLITGYPDGTFSPSKELGFVEAAKIIALAAKLDTTLYDAQSWYEPYVVTLERNKTIPISIISFDQKITRGEIAEMVYRIKAGVTNKPSKTYDDIEALDISNWQLHLNPTLHYSFKYPDDWVVIENAENEFIIATDTKCGKDDGSAEKQVEQWNQCDRLRVWTGDSVGATYGESATEISIGGEAGEMFVENIPAQGSVDGKIVYIPVAHIGGQVFTHGTWYKFSLSFHQQAIVHALKLFNALISTVQFL